MRLRVFEARYVDMVRRCMREQSPFGVTLIRIGREVGEVTEVAQTGTSARIVDFDTLPDGLLGLSCIGERRFRILRRWRQSDGLNLAEIDWLPEEPAVALPEQYAHLKDVLDALLARLGDLYDGIPRRFEDAGWVACRLAEILPLPLPEKQLLLEVDDPVDRLARLSALVRQPQA